MRKLALAAQFIFAAVALPAAAATPDWTTFSATPYDPPKPAPEFSLPDLDGHSVALAELRGKVTLVFFWATW